MADLKEKTECFFHLHWPNNAGDPPKWNDSYKFIGALPYGDRCGCYALFQGDQLQYIGSGVSRGAGIYLHHGLGKRIGAHVLMHDKTVRGTVAERRYKFRPRWSECSRICTLGFPHKYGYLALALEWFLVNELHPPGNVKGRV